MNIKLIACGSRPWEYWMGRWGLSFLIGEDILFDTFSSERILLKNMRRFNVDLGKIQNVVISHDHWDHTGGLGEVVKQRPRVNVYLPQHVAEHKKERIRAEGGNVIDSAGIKEIGADVFVTSEMMGMAKGKPTPEQALVIKSEKGLVLIVGCSHAGILTMVEEVKRTFSAPVYGVIGGFHLMNHTLKDVRVCAESLKALGVAMVAPTHCTGWMAEHVFRSVFGKGFVGVKEGMGLVV